MRLRLEVQKLDTPYKVAFNSIMKHYGAGCYPQDPQDEENFWKVPIGVHFPSSVVDQRTTIERVFTFHFGDVGEIILQKSTLKIVRRSSLPSIVQSIREKRREVSRKVERDLIQIIGNPDLRVKFDVLKYAHLGVQPIYRTITRLLETPEKYPPRNWVEQIGYSDLVNLIVDIGYAYYTNEEPQRLAPTNELKDLHNRMDGVAITTAEAIIGLVLAKHYEYLYETKRIIHFVPYVRASTTYYTDAIQFGSLIHITEDHLLQSIQKYYKVAPHPSPKARFGYPTILRELVEADILRSEGRYITGRNEIFEELIHIRDEFPMTEPPYSS